MGEMDTQDFNHLAYLFYTWQRALHFHIAKQTNFCFVMIYTQARVCAKKFDGVE